MNSFLATTKMFLRIVLLIVSINHCFYYFQILFFRDIFILLIINMKLLERKMLATHFPLYLSTEIWLVQVTKFFTNFAAIFRYLFAERLLSGLVQLYQLEGGNFEPAKLILHAIVRQNRHQNIFRQDQQTSLFSSFRNLAKKFLWIR